MVRKECKTSNPSRDPPCYIPKKKLPTSKVLSASHKYLLLLFCTLYHKAFSADIG